MKTLLFYFKSGNIVPIDHKREKQKQAHSKQFKLR